MRERIAVFAEGRNFGEGVPGAGEKLLSGGRIEGDGYLKTGSVEELGIGEIHGRVIAIGGNAGPGNVHGGGIGNVNDADSASGVQKFPALASSLIVRGESGGNIRGRAGEINDDFSFEIEAGQFVEIFFGDFQAVADKNQRRRDSDGRASGTRADESIIGEGNKFGLAAGDERKRGLCFIHLILIETDGLIEAIRTCGLETGLLELFDGIGLGFAKTFAACVAAFERIVSEKFDVRPPGIAVEVGGRRSLLGHGGDGDSEEEDEQETFAHEIDLINHLT